MIQDTAHKQPIASVCSTPQLTLCHLLLTSTDLEPQSREKTETSITVRESDAW
ncbi:hypothetical protein I79_013415 [Cricetulus griseus]|uniref:Uncharacterized protein n=1 Tax=Cricetulus griseus TaxID=10029 RepID=G3HRE8_CRIGR|nr:hypothetical protein I79_013415 [Cricetulus griseus]